MTRLLNVVAPEVRAAVQSKAKAGKSFDVISRELEAEFGVIISRNAIGQWLQSMTPKAPTK